MLALPGIVRDEKLGAWTVPIIREHSTTSTIHVFSDADLQRKSFRKAAEFLQGVMIGSIKPSFAEVTFVDRIGVCFVFICTILLRRLDASTVLLGPAPSTSTLIPPGLERALHCSQMQS
jgi:hypothetical protein